VHATVDGSRLVNINLEHTARQDRVVRATVAEAIAGQQVQVRCCNAMAGVKSAGLFEKKP